MSTDNTDYGFPCNLNTPKVAVLLLEAVMTNPNGNPNSGGNPRTLEVLDRGHITNGAIKRKMRDYLLAMEKDEKHFVHPGRDLGDVQSEYKSTDDMIKGLRDLRYFGGLLTRRNAKVRGPFVVEDAISIHPVNIMEIQITRVSHHKKEDGKEGSNMGSRSVVEYGLYRCVIHFDPMAASQVGLSEQDMRLYWEALIECWEHTRSATRPALNIRRLYCFDYPRRRGGVPQHVVTSWVKIESDLDNKSWASSFEDYTISVETSKLQKGMTLYAWEDGIVTTASGPVTP